MTLPTGSERDFEQAKCLLEDYSFDLGGYKAGELVAIWQERLGADPSWIRAAAIEALYQGRYKAYSVEQILQTWKRRGYPIRHFTGEFERIILGSPELVVNTYSSSVGGAPTATSTPSRSQASPEDSDADHSTPATDAPSPVVPQAKEQVSSSTDSPSSSPPADIPPPTFQTSASIPPGDALAFTFTPPRPIRKFEPDAMASEFYNRLQAVARHPFQP